MATLLFSTSTVFCVVAIIVLGFILYVHLELGKAALIEKEYIWRHCLKEYIKEAAKCLKGELERMAPKDDDIPLYARYFHGVDYPIRKAEAMEKRSPGYWDALDPKAKEKELDAQRKVLELSKKLGATVKEHHAQFATLACELEKEKSRLPRVGN